MRRVRRVLKVTAIAILAATGFGFAVMGLWNWLAPAVFGLRAITFWQALGLLILARILVGGTGGGTSHDKGGRDRMKDRWEQMTPGEREAFRQGLRDTCGGRRTAEAGPEPAGE